MKIIVSHPVKAYLTGTDSEIADVSSQLTYTNTGVQHLIKRHYNNFYWRSRNKVTWEEHLIELQKQLKKTLVFKDEKGTYIRPGSISYLGGLDIQIENLVKYPAFKKMPWAKPLPFDLHPYQQSSVEKLLAEKHGNVSLTTGSGKSAISLKLCRDSGLRAAIIAPSKAIFKELKEKFEYHFGRGKVGTFGDGKKKLDKQFTICIGDSIANIKPDTPEYDFFSNLDMIIVDESHTFAAESLETICHDVLGNIPYRFFLSATQVRGDGTLPLLQSIIGRTVESLSTSEAVAKGYISPHEFRVVQIASSNPSFSSNDGLEMKRQHFLRNTNIAAFCAKLANTMASRGEQTLILVEELSQLAMIIPLLKTTYALAHAESSSAKLAEFGLPKVDPKESIEKFNMAEAMVLMGTSCIRTGCNIYPVHHCINAFGGSSEISTKQGAVGRAIRFGKSNPYASKCKAKEKSIIWDFDVNGIPTMQRQLGERIKFYEESGSPIIYVKF